MDIHSLRYCKDRILAGTDDDPRCELMPLNDFPITRWRLHPCNVEDCPTGKFELRGDAPVVIDGTAKSIS
ncbi:MAG: hypothetical protein V1899_02780 [Planctomycetota bacterium]